MPGLLKVWSGTSCTRVTWLAYKKRRIFRVLLQSKPIELISLEKELKDLHFKQVSQVSPMLLKSLKTLAYALKLSNSISSDSPASIPVCSVPVVKMHVQVQGGTNSSKNSPGLAWHDAIGYVVLHPISTAKAVN